jgi:hypothetical protein
MDRGLLVGTLVALGGALVSLLWLPSRARQAEPIELRVDRDAGELARAAERVEP